MNTIIYFAVAVLAVALPLRAWLQRRQDPLRLAFTMLGLNLAWVYGSFGLYLVRGHATFDLAHAAGAALLPGSLESFLRVLVRPAGQPSPPPSRLRWVGLGVALVYLALEAWIGPNRPGASPADVLLGIFVFAGMGLSLFRVAGRYRSTGQRVTRGRLAYLGAAAAAEDEAFIQESLAMVVNGRHYFYRAFDEIGIHYLPTQSNFIFLTDLPMDANYICDEAMQRGVVAGYPVDDVRVALVAGQFHEVDSAQLDFHIAGSKAVRAALARARPALMEPIMRADLDVSTELIGAVTADLGRSRGRVRSVEPRGPRCHIDGEMPLSEASGYATDLRSLTGGRGRFMLELLHYDVVPADAAARVVERRAAEQQATR